MSMTSFLAKENPCVEGCSLHCVEPRIGRLLSLPAGTWADEDFESSHQASQVALAVERDCRKGKGEKEGSLPLTGCFTLFFLPDTGITSHIPVSLEGTESCGHTHLPGELGESNYVLRKKGNISATGRYECPHFTDEEMSGHTK